MRRCRERNGCTGEIVNTVGCAHLRARCYSACKAALDHCTTQSSEVAKAADTCGTLGDVKRSCTELSEEGTLKEKGGKLNLFGGPCTAWIVA